MPFARLAARTAVLLAGACLAAATRAYDPETGHAVLGRIAFDAHARCFPDAPPIDASTRERVLLGTRAMDEGTLILPFDDQYDRAKRDLLGVHVRLFNWHFYHPDKRDPALTRRNWIDQSHRRLWRRALDGVTGATQPEDRALYLGALMHLVEDVSVPAHVVPVYHGPRHVFLVGRFDPLVRYLEEAGRADGALISDAVDGEPPDAGAVLAAFTRGSAPCRGARRERDSPGAVRDDLARATLAALDAPVPGCPGVRWRTFWDGALPDGAGRYFAAYNVDAPVFGDAGTVGGTDCVFAPDDARYRAFLLERHRQAVEADLRLLRWARTLPAAP